MTAATLLKISNSHSPPTFLQLPETGRSQGKVQVLLIALPGPSSKCNRAHQAHEYIEKGRGPADRRPGDKESGEVSDKREACGRQSSSDGEQSAAIITIKMRQWEKPLRMLEPFARVILKQACSGQIRDVFSRSKHKTTTMSPIRTAKPRRYKNYGASQDGDNEESERSRHQSFPMLRKWKHGHCMFTLKYRRLAGNF